MNARSIWITEDSKIQTYDQRCLPHQEIVYDLDTLESAVIAIKDMVVRGAPLIGVTAAFGLYLSQKNSELSLQEAAKKLIRTRPTASNLKWAIDQQLKAVENVDDKSQVSKILLENAIKIAQDDVQKCASIGNFGLILIKSLKTDRTVNIMTHCNAGWLACVEFGTATSAIYQAHEEGIPVHVWVSETRPRNQGFNLTAWELQKAGVPHTVIVDNASGHLMQQGKVDLVITGTDRTARNGDVANKIGTYMKALAASENNIPFYVALPSSSIDWLAETGSDIPIEERDTMEVTHISGSSGSEITTVQLTPDNVQAANYAFDITPANLVTRLITERGDCEASEKGLTELFPEFS